MFYERLKKEKLIAVLRATSAEKCLEFAKQCYEGGIRILEITFTVPNAPEVIGNLSEQFPDAIIGAGTVLDVEAYKAAVKSGARFIVSPHLSEQMALLAEVPYLPGIMTPTEYMKARTLGCEVVKVFPGSVLKPSFIKALLGPFPEMKAVPTGGVSLDNIEEWLNAGAFAVGVGSSLTKGNVKENAEKFVEIVRGYVK